MTQPTAKPAPLRLAVFPFFVAWAATLALGAAEVQLPDPPNAPGATLFGDRPLPILRLRIEAKDIARLRQNSRGDVPADVHAGTTQFTRVAVHLKGSSGSFQPVDRKPSWTLTFDELTPGQRFHGLSKIHLNNAAEDPSFFHEYAGALIFQRAALPAPRVTHALVFLNDRRLGLYVLKEGFTGEFLALHFRNTNGNLYEPETGHDVDEALTKERGLGPDDRSDLLALSKAASDPNPTQRWEALASVLHSDRFLEFLAMEVMLGHRDGYGLARNNFRLYHEPNTGRFFFLPHGMDQLFGRPDAPIRPHFQGLVARAVFSTPAGRNAYSLHLAQLLTNAFDIPTLRRESDAFFHRANAILQPPESDALQQELANVNRRIAARWQSVQAQLREPEPAPPHFTNGLVTLDQWRPVDPPPDGSLDRSPAPDGRPALRIQAGARTSASWRTRILLEPGRYRLHAAVRLEAVKPLAFGKNHGAALRVIPGPTPSPSPLVGDQPWTRLERTFEVSTTGDYELACELRASAGTSWFATDSLRLESLPN